MVCDESFTDSLLVFWKSILKISTDTILFEQSKQIWILFQFFFFCEKMKRDSMALWSVWKNIYIFKCSALKIINTCWRRNNRLFFIKRFKIWWCVHITNLTQRIWISVLALAGIHYISWWGGKNPKKSSVWQPQGS